MNLRTFTAGSMADALGLVKKELGANALIVHTRSYKRRRWFGLRGDEMVEITASDEKLHRAKRQVPGATAATESPRRTMQLSSTRLTAPAFAGVQPPATISVGTAHAKPHAQPHVPPRESPREARQTLLQTPAAGSAMMLNLTQEMGTLKNMVMDLVTETRMRQAPDVPEALFDYYLQLIQGQVAEELATQIIKNLHSQLRPDQIKQEHLVRQKLAEQLEKMMPVSGPIVRQKTTGPHVVALIGPTGVGKTTTLAKLAANLKLRENHSVGLITIDTYRIAAVDQLRKYADIIGSPLSVVDTPESLREAIASMNDLEFVLIDTAGRSPTDTLKLNELKNFITAANADEVHLVISSTQSQACIERAIDRFSAVRVDKVIFTKFDEAVHVGVVFNVANKLKKVMSYVTTGQNVPDDIEVGRGRRLAQILLGTEL